MAKQGELTEHQREGLLVIARAPGGWARQSGSTAEHWTERSGRVWPATIDGRTAFALERRGLARFRRVVREGSSFAQDSWELTEAGAELAEALEDAERARRAAWEARRAAGGR